MLTMPISGKTSLQQYLGRLLRNLDETEKHYVFDYVDYAIPMMYRMYQRRLSYYRKAGYFIMTDIHSNQYKSELITQNYREIFVPIVLVKHQATMSSIVVYIRCLLSVNLTKYKLLYCFR